MTLCLLLCCRLPAYADTSASSPGMFYLTIKMFSVLAVVIGIMLLCLNLLKKYGPRGNMLFSDKKFIKVIETHYFDPKKSMVLVKVASEYLLLGISPNDIRFIKNIDMAESDAALHTDPNRDQGNTQTEANNMKIQSILKKAHLIRK